MSLTYQPFAQTPEVHRLAQDLRMNVPDGERFATVGLGAALMVAGAARSGILRWVLLLVGGAIVRRSVTGQCAVYRSLGVDRRHEG